MGHLHDAVPGHAATFDVRVGGRQTRALFDTGATCSCMSESYATSTGLTVEPHDRQLLGIGGSATSVGTVTCPVKIGRFQAEQIFIVTTAPLAGYDCIVGQDYMTAHSVLVDLRPDCAKLWVRTEAAKDKAGRFVEICRPIRTTDSVRTQRHESVNMVLPVAFAAVSGEAAKETVPPSRRASKRLLKDIQKGKVPGYRIYVTAVKKGPSDPAESVPPSVQGVLDKHSQPGGTLAGTIPNNTHALGFE